MTIKALDTLLAAKVINVLPGLRPSDRKVALALIEHFNRKTGRCDPGIRRIASLLDCCTRTVIRATNRLEKLGLFEKDRHGGYSNRNCYRPNWKRFAAHEAAWNTKLRAASRSRISEMSLSIGRESHSSADIHVTQTCSTNILSKKTHVGHPRKETWESPKRKTCSQASTDAARIQAERRWSDDLLRAYRSRPLTYGEIVERIDQELASAATDAELSARGSGLCVIQRQLKLAVD